MKTIDFSSNIPYYVQLISIMNEAIRGGVWKSGEKIPGEVELCAMFGISRTVVRQTLGELEAEGLIYRKKGIGTFVAQPKIVENLVQKLTGFFQDMEERGLHHKTTVLSQKVLPASEIVAKNLDLHPGDPVIAIDRLRFVQEEPIQLVSSYLTYALCPKLAAADLSNESLYKFLEDQCNLFIMRGRRFIEAVAATEEEAHLLNVYPGAPLVLLDSVSYLENNRPIEYYRAKHRGDRSRFEVVLIRQPEMMNLVDHSSSILELPGSNLVIK